MAHKYHATAHEAFEARAAEIVETLDRLHHALALKREYEALDPANWGHAGDLGHVAGLLDQALAFIGGRVLPVDTEE